MNPFLKGIGIVVGIAVVGGGIAAAYLAGRHANQEDIQRALNTPPPAQTYQLPTTPTYLISTTPGTALQPIAPTTSPAPTSAPPIAKPKERTIVPYRRLTHSEIAQKYIFSFEKSLLSEIERGGVKLLGIEGDFTNDGLPDIFIVYQPDYNTCYLCIPPFYFGLENTGVGYRKIVPRETIAWFPNGASRQLQKGYFAGQILDFPSITITRNIYPINLDNGPQNIVLELIHRDSMRKSFVIHPFSEKKTAHVMMDEPLDSTLLLGDFDGKGNYDFGILRYFGEPITIYKHEGTRLERMQNTEAQVANNFENIVRTILNTSYSEDQKRKELERILSSNPHVASISLGLVLNGVDVNKYLQQQNLGMAVTQYYSELVSGNFSDAAAGLLTGNLSGAVANTFLAWINTERAKNELRAVEGRQEGGKEVYRDPATGDLWERTQSGLWRHLGTNQEDQIYNLAGACDVKASQLTTLERAGVVTESRVNQLCGR